MCFQTKAVKQYEIFDVSVHFLSYLLNKNAGAFHIFAMKAAIKQKLLTAA